MIFIDNMKTLMIKEERKEYDVKTPLSVTAGEFFVYIEGREKAVEGV